MKDRRYSILKWQTGTFCLAMIFLVGPVSAWAQSEKRSVFAPDDFHWRGNLKAGQTLEVINRNGEIEASAASGDEARATGTSRGFSDDRGFFVEVVEYPDGVTICAVYARDKAPGVATGAESPPSLLGGGTGTARRSTLTSRCRGACASM